MDSNKMKCQYFQPQNAIQEFGIVSFLRAVCTFDTKGTTSQILISVLEGGDSSKSFITLLFGVKKLQLTIVGCRPLSCSLLSNGSIHLGINYLVSNETKRDE
jgi:hypothetical protein